MRHVSCALAIAFYSEISHVLSENCVKLQLMFNENAIEGFMIFVLILDVT